jgi:hypothetical protein
MKEPLYDRAGMARMIRTFFIERKTEITPSKKYRPNPRHDNWDNWEKAADACIAAGANPRDWVDASFNLAPATLFANQLAGPAALARWKSHTNAEKVESSMPLDQEVENDPGEYRGPVCELYADTVLMDEIRVEIGVVLMYFQTLTGDSNPANNSAALENEFSFIRPHIRVALAGKQGMWGVVRKFKDAASRFLSNHPAHMTCLIQLEYDMPTYLNVH